MRVVGLKVESDVIYVILFFVIVCEVGCIDWFLLFVIFLGCVDVLNEFFMNESVFREFWMNIVKRVVINMSDVMLKNYFMVFVLDI